MFDATDITPDAPIDISGTVISSQPLIIKKSSDMRDATRAAYEIFPLASFIPIIFSWFESSASVSVSTLHPVRDGTL